MPSVFGRRTYQGAAILLVIAFVGLHRAADDVAHYSTEIAGQIPAVVYEPGEARPFGAPPAADPKLPVVILAHGFSGNSGMMSFLARKLARAGYAVVCLEFEGHGRNPNPFAFSSGRSGLHDDLDAALLFARTQPHFDQERIAIAGHSMGGFASLDYASRNPGVSAVVGLSGGGPPTGPFTPPNTLLIFASGDPEGLREASREAGARIAGLDRVVLERTYGDPRRGRAVRVSEVSGVDHLTILYSAEAASRIVAWLGETLGPGAEPAPGRDWRLAWSGLAFLAFLLLLPALIDALAPLLPRVELPGVDRPLRAFGELFAALVGAVLVLAAVDSQATSGPFGFIPVLVGRELAGFYAATGLLLALPLLRLGKMPVRGLFDARTWAGAAALVVFAYFVFGAIAQPFSSTWLAGHRLLPAAVCALLSFPLFASMEWLLRGPGRVGVWAPIAGKLLLVATLTVAVLMGILPFVLLLGLGAFVLLFAIFELACWRLSRVAPNPWLAALFQSAWTGWTLGAIFPYTG
jgi:dienelactone hydrolase